MAPGPSPTSQIDDFFLEGLGQGDAAATDDIDWSMIEPLSPTPPSPMRHGTSQTTQVASDNIDPALAESNNVLMAPGPSPTSQIDDFFMEELGQGDPAASDDIDWSMIGPLSTTPPSSMHNSFDVQGSQSPPRSMSPNEGSQTIPNDCEGDSLRCYEHGCNGRKFSSRSNLRRHRVEKSKMRPSCKCPICGAVFKSGDTLMVASAQYPDVTRHDAAADGASYTRSLSAN
ncbi:hypothetical protein TI39_contig4417g00006 [Zymoseptoria brevis]|uniref:C2H2-type domain-containing protein n=1 Tax=Zymoseptoria brevis TaxID=1047168 RepID=A0A0F4G6U2_9PEZI|nr:hypothetical protein TI39_contig4417g00006 [Zymoseptoria brevis]